MVTATIATSLNYLRILIVAIIRATKSRLSALNVLSLRAGRNKHTNYSIVDYYTKKRSNSGLRIY